MSKKLDFVSLRAMYHLTKGLSFSVSRCAEVLDRALVQLNIQTGIPDKIVQWNERGGNTRRLPTLQIPGRLIVEITETFSPSKGKMQMVQMFTKQDDTETAPVAFFSMRSPTLDIPMRVEIPLRALIKRGPNLSRSYAVYLHALLSDEEREYVYYGVTKRGWNIRFSEHTKAAIAKRSPRLFSRTLADLIDARVAERAGKEDPRPKLAGIVSSICTVGVDEDMALDIEEYLVDKYSLAEKHPTGLNMIPGGREGIRVLHRYSHSAKGDLVDTDIRETNFDVLLRGSPQFSVPKPGVASAWNDPVYAEAVICGQHNRLSAEQVREIRFLAASGWDVGSILYKIETIDEGQIRRVLAGRTYARIR